MPYAQVRALDRRVLNATPLKTPTLFIAKRYSVFSRDLSFVVHPTRFCRSGLEVVHEALRRRLRVIAGVRSMPRAVARGLTAMEGVQVSALSYKDSDGVRRPRR
eukprot:7399752-Pyramimonas_sp.AAC.1